MIKATKEPGHLGKHKDAVKMRSAFPNRREGDKWGVIS